MKIKIPSITGIFAAIEIGKRILDAISDKDIGTDPIPLGEVLILKQSGRRIYLDAKLIVR